MCIIELDSCGWVRLGVLAVASGTLGFGFTHSPLDCGLGTIGLDNNGFCLLSALTQVWSVGVSPFGGPLL